MSNLCHSPNCTVRVTHYEKEHPKCIHKTMTPQSETPESTASNIRDVGDMELIDDLKRELSEKSRQCEDWKRRLNEQNAYESFLAEETKKLDRQFRDRLAALTTQRDALKKQVDSAFKLLNAVTDSGCNDVDGKNWYDARTALLSQASNPTP